jgi:hypothetical protein
MPLLQEIVPSMEVISLLREALKQLDQPFLWVIVGKYNSTQVHSDRMPCWACFYCAIMHH